MLKTMMHALEALDGGEAPLAIQIQIHSKSNKQHAAYLGTLSSLLGQGVDSRWEADGAVYSWHEWRHGELRQGVIVLHEPHSAGDENDEEVC